MPEGEVQFKLKPPPPEWEAGKFNLKQITFYGRSVLCCKYSSILCSAYSSIVCTSDFFLLEDSHLVCGRPGLFYMCIYNRPHRSTLFVKWIVIDYFSSFFFVLYQGSHKLP